MNEQLHTRLIDHIMAGIEDIAGHFGHHELRERFHRIDNKHLKPILLRKASRRMRDRGFSILEVYKKLNERDVEEYIKRNNTGLFMKRNSFTTAQSILDLIQKNHSDISLESKATDTLRVGRSLVDVSGCGTPLDMNVLEHQNTKKNRDDSRIHHILDEALFKPRKSFNVHLRNMLPKNESQQVFNYKARYHLRKQLHSKHRQHSKKGHHSHTHKPKSANSPTNRNVNKTKKNVSFNATGSKSGKDGHVIINIPPDKDKSIFDADNDAKSDTSSDGGIVIKFKPRSEEDNKCDGLDLKQPLSVITALTGSEVSSESPSPLLKPAAVETSLPWKRSCEPLPLSSSFNHSMPCDDQPQMCEVPSWVNNEQFTVQAESSPADNQKEDIGVKEEVFASTPLPPASYVPEAKPSINSQTLHSDPEQFRTNNNKECEQNMSLSSVNNSNNTSLTPKMPSSNISKSSAAEHTQIYDYSNGFCTPSRSENMHNNDANMNKQANAERVEVGFSLPLPWSNSSDIDAPRLSIHNESAVIPHLAQSQTSPEPLQNLPDDDQLSSCHLSDSNEAAVSEDNCDACIPPPWLRAEGHVPIPVLSPSASFEMDSLQPQPSSQSQRLSEVASHHSEPYLMHHHLIDLPPRPPVDYEIASTLESLDIEDDQFDYMSRVHQWLVSNNPEEQEPLLEDHHNLEHLERAQAEAKGVSTEHFLQFHSATEQTHL